MKRLFITLLCIVMVMTFAGCSGNWKDNAVAGWDNLANSLSKSQITKDDDLIGERTLSDDDYYTGSYTAECENTDNREFSDDDGVMHDVYFALAKAEWMCCAQSKMILDKVEKIIESGANICFYRELEATEKDLKLRQKNLEKFWASLQTPRVKPRQRRIDPLDRIKELPPVQTGECYAYKHENGYRILVILDRFKKPDLLEQIRVCVLKDTFPTRQADVKAEKIAYIADYIGIEFLGKSNLYKLPTIDLAPDFGNRLPPQYVSWYGRKSDFHKENMSALNKSIEELSADCTP